MSTMARCYEDFAVGEVVEAGPVVVTADAIKAFVAQFDPRPSYPNDTVPYGAVASQVASGLHITCLNMRLLVDTFLCDTKAMGSPGVEEVCYFSPVRAGDSLTMRLEVIGLRRSPARADIGLLRCTSEMRNTSGTPVMRMTLTLMFARREVVVDGASPT
jgi:acyl dehydratase